MPKSLLHVIKVKVTKMLSSFQEWQESRGNRKKPDHRGTVRTADMRPTTASSRAGISAQSEVQTYSQMQRSMSGGQRPPSLVGSQRSFRSVLTVEEQVGALEEKVQAIADNQQELNVKLDKVLALLSTTTITASRPESKGKRSEGSRG